MPANRKGKCDRCNKQRTDLELCGDDLLCRPCEIKNAVELTKRKLGRDISITEGGVAGEHPSLRMVPVWKTLVIYNPYFKVTINKRQVTQKWYNIELCLQWPTNRKS